jgi:hypothetical protein
MKKKIARMFLDRVHLQFKSVLIYAFVHSILALSSVADPDPHQSEKQDPDPQQSEKVEAIEGHFEAFLFFFCWKKWGSLQVMNCKY